MKKRKLNKRISLLLTAAVLSSTAAFAGIAITEPKDGATVPLLTDAQKAYLAMPRAERRTKISDSLERWMSRIMMESSAERDRAGSVAFILNALWGVEKVQLYLDWRTTGLWDSSIGYRQKRRFDALVRGFRKKHPAPTINESVEKYVLSLGFTSEDIATFRSIMFFGLHPFFERRISPNP